ncbi:glycerol-3-phosphate dehydrogenase/oxidase [Solimonas marina]|uniref:Glycerol-3-phosphate dehydrogenase/oxidase n=1 Tax=Solimonas marina TaxID=2714601 RepID=A0A969WD82_9GAMM|nr:glycerol-3-phosphate dehydrogenase/oxidase [Solimonas marina]NKF22650.1 glycerol-3-phosphate dehydrogenase/oxidase [Solimonas marina]
MPTRPMLSQLDARYDLIVVGGGINGAGIFQAAARRGLQALLIDAGDFASGTSSASSKLVHGGLRYLKNGQWRLTLESVRERERLLREVPGLVEPLRFLMPIYRDRKPGRRLMQFGLRVYDLMAGSQRSRWLDAEAVQAAEGDLRSAQLLGAMAYDDAVTDDARLVLRLVFDGVAADGTALNYVRATLLRDGHLVVGVRLHDAVQGGARDIAATVVVNAAGALADRVPDAPAGAPLLRPLRGSHLVLPTSLLPIRHAVSWLHPRDGRPVFVHPWEGAVICGTTDVDHDGDPADVRATAAELDYLLEALQAQFPQRRWRLADAVSVYAGVRPVVAGGHDDPSRESRESAMWQSPGLIGTAGGKLTTFRVTAQQVLRAARRELPALRGRHDGALFAGERATDRLGGRYGASAAATMRADPASAQAPLAGTPYSLAELRWSLQHEAVVHLDDLLLRRSRLGLVAAGGGEALLPQIGALCQQELGWDDLRWQREYERYLTLWRHRHAPPV